MSKRKTSEFEKSVLDYLNDLRRSGVVNMFGAASYIESAFEVNKRTARMLLKLWMENFNDEGNYDEVILTITINGGQPITEEEVVS
jgi:hypothetical protein